MDPLTVHYSKACVLHLVPSTLREPPIIHNRRAAHNASLVLCYRPCDRCEMTRLLGIYTYKQRRMHTTILHIQSLTIHHFSCYMDVIPGYPRTSKYHP